MPTTTKHHQRLAVEDWLRQNGLPLLVAQRHMLANLLGRSAAPLTVYFLLNLINALVLLGTRAIGLERLNDQLDTRTNNDASQIDELLAALLVLGVIVGILLIIAGIMWGLVYLLWRWSQNSQAAWRIWGILAVLLNIVLTPLWMELAKMGSYWASFGINLVLVIVVLVLVASGLGAFLAWAGRAALGQFSIMRSLTSVALPLLIFVVIFAFYSTEIWQMSAMLAPVRLLVLAAFLLSLGVLFVIYSASGELHTATRNMDEQEQAALLAQTPIAELEEGIPLANPELNKLQRLNVLAVLVSAQFFQAMMIGFIITVVMGVLVAISVPPELIHVWSRQESSQIELWGLRLPVESTTVKVCVFMGVLAALNFMISAGSTKDYRMAFFEPLLSQIRTALAVHAVYSATLAQREDLDDDDVLAISRSMNQFLDWDRSRSAHPARKPHTSEEDTKA